LIVDGTCRYGTLCTFAHGDNEMRSKNENIMRVQQQMFPFMDMNNPMMSPMNMPPFQMNMMNPFMMPIDPNQMGAFNNDPQNFDMNPNMMMNPMFGQMGNMPFDNQQYPDNSTGNNN
jgi:Zinc finger C-x8-C-x5-C-x3-H type (and similar)